MLRFLLWAILFYLLFRTIRNVFIAMTPKKNGQQKKSNNPAPSHYKIEKEDIIEADFEEIKNSEKSKNKT